MNNEERIEKFNEENVPFYLVDLGDEYSLCFLLGGTPTATVEYGQDAFDHYAESVGKPAQESGWITYGDGYDWECVFKKVFENDPSLSKVNFDCEASGFFCNSEDLSVLESFGSRFKALCENKPAFEKVVAEAMTEADQMRQESEKECQTIKEFIEQHLNCSFDMITPMGYVHLTPEDSANLLQGGSILGHLGFGDPSHTIQAEDLLPLPVEYWRQDNGNPTHYSMMVGLPSLDEQPEQTISM